MQIIVSAIYGLKFGIEYIDGDDYALEHGHLVSITLGFLEIVFSWGER